MLRSLFSARLPCNAVGICEDHAVTVEVKRKRGGFALKSFGYREIPAELLHSSFHRLNISDEQAFIQLLWETAESAGLLNRSKWSVALPVGCSRSAIVSLEGAPANRHEQREMLLWKAERLFGVPGADLRLSFQRLLRTSEQARYLITAIRNDVASQYDDVFKGLGWTAGLILPQHLAESLWLGVSDGEADSLLVSSHPDGLMAIVLRGGEPVVLRWHSCDESARLDELYRFLLYYRDHVSGDRGADLTLGKVLVLGNQPRSDEVARIIHEALEMQPEIIGSESAGLECGGTLVPFSRVASAAGLATSAWVS